MSQLRRSICAAVALTLAALALSGCLRFDLDLTVNSDETVDGTVLLAVRKSLLTTMGGANAERAFDEITAGDLKGLPAGTTVEPYDQDGFYGKKMTYDNVPFSEFDKAAGGRAGQPSFRREAGRITFTMRIDMGERKPLDAGLFGAMMTDLRVRIAITFPGRVIEQDHGVVSGDTVTWDIGVGTDQQLRAVAEDGTAMTWGYFVLGGCCLLMVLVVAALAIWLILRRRGTATVTPVTQPEPVASGATDPTVAGPPTHPGPDADRP